MLFADELPSTYVQLLGVIVTALVGAWMTVRIAQIDRQAKRERRRARAEKKRCDGLELRVGDLEKALIACEQARKRR